jgi:ubiquinone/menaquinone biosynthesis C-methylase UbiE
MNDNDEIQRLIEVYARRDSLMLWDDWRTNIYHPRHPLGNLFYEHNHKVLVDLINQLDLDLSGLIIMDIGCGFGHWLRYLVELGAIPGNCFGIDLSDLRLKVARQKNSLVNWFQGNIIKLPFPDESFDLVFQSVVFSSILDLQVRRSCAAEMYRVTKKSGNIIWIDLINATNDSLVSFSVSEVQVYFPKMRIIYQRSVHPKYFRRINGRYAWLAKLIYQFTHLGCEAQLLMLRKP